MSRPPFEVADIIRQYGDSFIAKHRSWLTWLHLRILYAIKACRTGKLGGHLDRCSGCGHEAISYNSCRNRHCPKCQTNARDKWLAGRSKELLPVPYVHVVFTLPQELRALAAFAPRAVYDALFHAATRTLLEFGKSRLGGTLGATLVVSLVSAATCWAAPSGGSSVATPESCLALRLHGKKTEAAATEEKA